MPKKLSITLPPEYAEWKVLAWRMVRGAVATALAQTLSMQVDWTKPEVAVRTLVISLISGFLLALGKGIRDHFGDNDQSAGLVNKLIV